MSPRPQPAPGSQDRHTYIPPHVQQAMAQQAQHLNTPQMQKYGQGGYVPQHAQVAMTKQLQQHAPGYMKQYASAFVEQNIVHPVNPTPVKPAGPVRGPAPLPDKLKQSHSGDIAAEQGNAQFLHLFQTDGATPAAQTVAAADFTPPPASSYPTGYDFIMNPNQPAPQSRLPGGNSRLMRIVFASAGLLVLLIAFAVVKNLVAPKANLTPFISLAQQQQALIHILDSTDNQPGLTVTNQNFIATASLSLGTSQSQLLSYLNQNHTKLPVKQLNLKVSSTIDQQLKDAAAATTYNNTFKDIMQAKLTSYTTDLQRSSRQATGPKGRQLLKSDYQQAQLLLSQLQQP